MKNYDMVYDVAIIGNGVEAVSAAAHCSRSKAKTVLINLPEIQGDDLENLKLIHRLTQQARESGTKIVQCSVHSVWCKHFPKIIYTEEGSIMCKCIILAMGVSPAKLGVPMESYFHGCGLHYSNSFASSYLKGRVSLIYGKDDVAADQAITLSLLCKQVYLVYSSGNLLCSKEKVDVLKNSPNVIMLPHTLVYSIEQRNKKIVGASVLDKTTGNIGVLDCDVIYVSKGVEPNSKLCFPYILTDKNGFIVTDSTHKTNVEGVYAAGEIRSTVLDENPGSCCSKNAIMAATDGAIAATSAVRYICSLE